MSGGQHSAVSETGGSAELVARIVAGDRDAESEFVRRYERGVHILLRRHCRRADPVVADLAQDVLTTVLERLRAGALLDGNALPAYVRSTVVRTATAEYRRRRPVDAMSAVEDLPSHADPIDEHGSRELAGLLKKLLAELPMVRDREVLRRFYLADEDRDDVCRSLGIDTTHFHRVVHRARERFRSLLEEAGISGP